MMVAEVREHMAVIAHRLKEVEGALKRLRKRVNGDTQRLCEILAGRVMLTQEAHRVSWEEVLELVAELAPNFERRGAHGQYGRSRLKRTGLVRCVDCDGLVWRGEERLHWKEVHGEELAPTKLLRKFRAPGNDNPDEDEE
jgi:hypothetical protein